MGLWRPVRLELTRGVSLDDVFVRSEFDTGNPAEAFVTISATLRNHTDREIEAVVRARLADGRIWSGELDRRTFNDLLDEGFSAVFIAAGAQASKRIGIPGEEEDLEGLYYGLEFLSQVRAGEKVPLSGKTVIIGGGNVAVDVSLTAKRAGAKEVTMVCLESYDEMPAWEYEIEDAAEADEYIFGYTCVNDVTAIEFLFEDKAFQQWTRSKGYDTLPPLGPCINTEIDPAGLNILAIQSGDCLLDVRPARLLNEQRADGDFERVVRRPPALRSVTVIQTPVNIH